MLHAVVVTKAPTALDLLLKQGANPNANTMSQVEDDKVYKKRTRRKINVYADWLILYIGISLLLGCQCWLVSWTSKDC
jgi:hypothetical protein